MVEDAIIEKFKCDILSKFQTLCEVQNYPKIVWTHCISINFRFTGELEKKMVTIFRYFFLPLPSSLSFFLA